MKKDVCKNHKKRDCMKCFYTTRAEVPTVWTEPMGEWKTRNSKLLAEFVKYATEHPDERFWQCVRNFSGQDFICTAKMNNHTMEFEDVVDTFYWEGLTK